MTTQNSKEKRIRMTIGDKHMEYVFFNVPVDLEYQITKMLQTLVYDTALDVAAIVRDLAIWKKITAECCSPSDLHEILRRVEEYKF